MYVGSIRSAKIQNSDEVVIGEQVLGERHYGYEYRKQAIRNGVKYQCLDCGQPLYIRSSRKHNLYFSHYAKANYCRLTDTRFTQSEIEDFERQNRDRESPRHKQLKAEIVRRLGYTDGVEYDSIKAERCIGSTETYRRPDVQCRYKDKNLVFEIQLSYLSPKYILGRIDFYRSKNIYLIWILDSFQKDGQKSHELMIKYESSCHNFFKLDENKDGFWLICDFKKVLLSDNHSIYERWEKESVSLGQLNFDEKNFEVFFYDYFGQLAEADKLKNRLLSELAQQQYEDELDSQIAYTLNELRMCFREGSWPSPSTIQSIAYLSSEEKVYLNKKLGFKAKEHRGLPILHFLIRNNKHEFFRYLIQCDDIEIDVNKHTSNGDTLLQELINNYTNSDLTRQIKYIFRKGYKTTEKDMLLINEYLQRNCHNNSGQACIVYALAYLNDPNLHSLLMQDIHHIYVVRSLLALRDNAPLYYNFENHRALIHNFFNTQGNLKFGNLFLHALHVYGLDTEIFQTDIKGNILKRISTYRKSGISQSTDLDPVLIKMFPTLFSGN